MTPDQATSTTIARQAVEITYLHDQIDKLTGENDALRQALDAASARIEQLELHADDEARNDEARP